MTTYPAAEARHQMTGEACGTLPQPRRSIAHSLPAPNQDPLEPLASALLARRAFFSGSPITAVCAADSRGLRKLSAKAGGIFRAFPDVVIGSDVGIKHEISGLVFTDLVVGGSRHLVACGETGNGPLLPGPPADVVTGMCLFGVDSILGWAGLTAYPMTAARVVHEWDPANPIDDVTTDMRMHVYEVETLARLGSFVRAFAGLQGQGPVHVRAHIPGPEYDAYGLSLYARGLLSAELYARYRETVRRRARLIGDMLEWSLMGAAEVTLTSPLSLLDTIDVFNASPTDLPSLVHEAARQRDPLWAGLLAGKSPSFRTLITASYVYHYIAAAHQAEQQGHQMVFVENPEEEKIYRRAREECDRAGISLNGAPGFYVHPYVVATRTALGDGDRVLRHCMNGCEPSTVAIALDSYSNTLTTGR